MAETTGRQRFEAGFWSDNPTVVQVLGMCPTLAVTNSLENALVMGAAVTFVLLGANLMTSLLRKLIQPHVRILIFTLTIAAFVTIADLFLQAYLPAASKKLGPFVPLIIVNCIIIARCEVCAAKSGVWPSLCDAFGQGFGFTIALSILGVVREILGSGTLLNHPLVAPEAFKPHAWVIMILPPGAFIMLGILIGLANYLRQRRPKGAVV
jgi:electron transport complex protein RnfE